MISTCGHFFSVFSRWWAPIRLSHMSLQPSPTPFWGTEPEWAHLLGGGLVLWLIWDGMRRFGAGWVGTFFCTGTALVWLQAEGSGVDLMASACVLQSLSHLAKSARLTERRHVILWGVWMGLGFLCKYTAPIFMVGPCVLAGWWVVRDRQWKPLGMAVGSFGLVAGIWYVVHLNGVMGYIQQSQGASEETRNVMTNKALIEQPWSAEEITWYPAVLLDAWGWAGLICLVVGCLFWGRRKAAPEGAWLLPILGSVMGLLILMGQSQRQDRYLLPALILWAAVIGSCRLRWLLAPVGILGTWHTASTYFLIEKAPLTRDYTHSWNMAGSQWPEVYTSFLPTSLSPEEWRVDYGVERLRHYQGTDTGTVGFLTDEQSGGPGSGLFLARASPRWSALGCSEHFHWCPGSRTWGWRSNHWCSTYEPLSVGWDLGRRVAEPLVYGCLRRD